MVWKKYSLFSKNLRQMVQHFRHVSYVQGQQPSPNLREYFYYIDHQGMVL